MYGTNSSDLNLQTTPQNIGNGTTQVNVTALLASLEPFTDYYYELVAVSADGTTYSPEQSCYTLGFDTSGSHCHGAERAGHGF